MSALELLYELGAVGELDYRLARTLAELDPSQSDESVLLAAALASRAAAEGHVCLDLASSAGRPLASEDAAAGKQSGDSGRLGREGQIASPPLAQWLAALRASPLVAEPGGYAPLVLEGTRLYLHRFWGYEASLARWIRQRVETPAEPFDRVRASRALDALFPSAGDGVPDWSKVAALASLLHRFTVVSGGPGTGKTTAAGRILEFMAAVRGEVRAVLAAPTGKAADRLAEAIGARPAVRTSGGMTVHRLLLELQAGRHGTADVAILDEASMADIAMLATLGNLLPQRTHLVLLGDRDQLASVEAGAVLGDLCAGPAGSLEQVPYSEGFRREVREVAGMELPEIRSGLASTPLRDSIVILERSYRFSAESGIGALSRAVNSGDAAAALAVLAQGRTGVCGEAGGEAVLVEDRSGLAERVVRGFAPYIERCRAGDAAAALAAQRSFCVLTALRYGPWGSLELNRWIEDRLAAAGLVRPLHRWYPGLPVLVTRNDHVQHLYNGDVGVVLPERDGGLAVFFAGAGGGLRSVAPMRLPEHEPAYAMTVHKSQGSEFDEVVVLLPPQPVRMLTRELLYTAITRARRRVEIWGSVEVVRCAVEARTLRASGLREALWRT